MNVPSGWNEMDENTEKSEASHRHRLAAVRLSVPTITPWKAVYGRDVT